jgi:hypothetical protein
MRGLRRPTGEFDNDTVVRARCAPSKDRFRLAADSFLVLAAGGAWIGKRGRLVEAKDTVLRWLSSSLLRNATEAEATSITHGRLNIVTHLPQLAFSPYGPSAFVKCFANKTFRPPPGSEQGIKRGSLPFDRPSRQKSNIGYGMSVRRTWQPYCNHCSTERRTAMSNFQEHGLEAKPGNLGTCARAT